MDAPTDRKYSKTHEWYLLEDDVVTMGITQFAADELSDLTFVELPEVGAKVSPGDSIGEVESVKATSEILTAIGGEVVAVNTELADHPELINDSAFEEGWMVKIRPDSTEPLTQLMDAKEYSELADAG
jgi:glycine cleavage system H protein